MNNIDCILYGIVRFYDASRAILKARFINFATIYYIQSSRIRQNYTKNLTFLSDFRGRWTRTGAGRCGHCNKTSFPL